MEKDNLFYFTDNEIINLNEIKTAKACRVMSGYSSSPAIQIIFKDGSHMNILYGTEQLAKDALSDMYEKIRG